MKLFKKKTKAQKDPNITFTETRMVETPMWLNAPKEDMLKNFAERVKFIETKYKINRILISWMPTKQIDWYVEEK